MPTIVDIRTAEDPRDVIHRAVQLLSAGEVVAFPTETVYLLAAHSLMPEAVNRLKDSTGATNDRLTLGIKGADEALDYVPDMSKLGKKLARRCWPGPVTLCFEVSTETSKSGFWEALPEDIRKHLLFHGQIAFRVPAHEVVTEVLRLLPAPLIFSVETNDDSPIATTTEEIVNKFGPVVSMVIDDGPSRYKQCSSLVEVLDDELRIVRPGVVTETMLRRLSSEVFLFVCTGNTCRSPMAEGLFRKFLAKRLQCQEDELMDRGYVVASAGLAADAGASASPESIEILKRHNIDIRSHVSQPLTGQLLNQADQIYTMTRNHRDVILAERPDLADRLQTLSRDGADISDPIGGGMAEYEKCEAEVERAVHAILDEFDFE